MQELLISTILRNSRVEMSTAMMYYKMCIYLWLKLDFHILYTMQWMYDELYTILKIPTSEKKDRAKPNIVDDLLTKKTQHLNRYGMPGNHQNL